MELNILSNSEKQIQKKNFDFIDSIRCIGMMCIVFEHCAYLGENVFNQINSKSLAYISILQFSKLGSITFFILAGFLIGSKFMDYSPWGYFKRRISTTFLPWLFWSILFVFIMTFQHANDNYSIFRTFLHSTKIVYLLTNYWFIINFLICTGVLLAFRKHLYSKVFGLILLLITLTYSVNIYVEWFPPRHTMAIFGFVFFLWLGAQFNKNWEVVQAKILAIPYWVFIALYIIIYISSIYEVTLLYKLNSIDPFNSLRITNILYSLICIFLLLKIRKFNFTNLFKPRETTFGVYLIHFILVFSLLPIILKPFNLPTYDEMSIASLFGVSLLRFVIVYSLTWLIVNFINKTKFKWSIGR
jgi:hypothetical protein